MVGEPHHSPNELGYDQSYKTYPSRTPPGKSACTRAPNGIIRTSLMNTGFGNCTRSKLSSCKQIRAFQHETKPQSLNRVIINSKNWTQHNKTNTLEVISFNDIHLHYLLQIFIQVILLKIYWSLHPYRQRRPTGNIYNALNLIRITK